LVRILIVARKTAAVEHLAAELRRDGYVLLWLSPHEALEGEGDFSPELVILDLEDPSPTGLLRQMKGRKSCPIIVLLPEGGKEPPSEVDDFLLRPLRPGEAAARVKWLLRRRNVADEDNLLRSGDLVVDLARYQAFLDGRPIPLTFKEYELLKLLMANKGRTFTREAILNRIWGYDYYGGERTVDVHIRRLRAKIELGGRSFIETVRGVGYRFKEKP